jgi:hypothetical protein
MGQTGKTNTTGFHQLRQVKYSGFAFHIRVGGTDDLMDPALLNTLQQRINPQLLWSDTIEGRQGPHQHVVQAFVDACAFDREDITRVLNDTNEATVSRWIGAYWTRIGLGNPTTLGAEDNLLFDLNNRLRQSLSAYFWGAQHKESQALCGLFANTGQTTELIN